MSPGKQKLLYFFTSFLTYLAIHCLIVFYSYQYMYTYVLWTCGGVFGIGFYLWHFQQRNVYNLPMSISIIFGLFFGVILGLYNYDVNYLFVEFYKNSQSYGNIKVTPAALADAVRDAGRIKFNSDSFVDTTRSVGWKAANGNTYCIAPIVPSSDPAQNVVEFYAVGLNCCSSVGHFNCDDTEDLTVHSGAVVFDNNGWFVSSNYDYYEKARKKAMGEFGLTAAPHVNHGTKKFVPQPAYLRWFKDTNAMQTKYNSAAIIFASVTSLIVAICSHLLAGTVTRNIGMVAMSVKAGRKG